MDNILSAIIGAFLGGAFTYYQFIYSKRKDKIEKSIEMAKEFECILSDLQFDIASVLLNLAKRARIDLEGLGSNEELAFNQHELYEKFSDETAKAFLSSMTSKNIMFLKLLTVYRIYRPDVKELQLEVAIRSFDEKLSFDKNVEKCSSNIKDEQQRNRFRLDLIAYVNELVSEFELQVNRVLNKLEWMSMYFNLGIAEEDAVYQSLHQVFLNTVTSLYVSIAERNTTPYDKHYDNVITLFNRWNGKLDSSRNEYNQKKKELSETGKTRLKKMR